jgi:PAS domain S-box-containing protein
MKILLKALFQLAGLVAGGFAWQCQSAQKPERSLEAQMLSFDEEQIRILFENSQLGIGLTTLEGKVLAANSSLLRMTGYTETELLEGNVIDLYVNPKARIELLEQLSTAKAVNNFGVALKRKDGSSIIANMNVSRIIRDGQEVLLAIIEDVTERLRIEEQLRFQAQLLDTVEQAVIVTNMSGHVVYWNPFAEQLYGWSAEEAVGRRTRDLRLISSGEAQQLNDEIVACMQTGESWSGEYLMRRRDGARLPVQTTISPITDPAGELTHIIGISVDITERKQAEIEINTRIGQLETLNLIGQTVSTVIGLREKVEIVATTMTRLFDATQVSINLLNRDQSEITVFAYFDRRLPVTSSGEEREAETNRGSSELEGMVFQIRDDPIARQLFEEKTAMVMSQPHNNPYLAPHRELLPKQQVECLMLVPMVSQGAVTGVITVATDQPGREFLPDEVTLAETIAGQIAGAIEVARLFEQAQQLAVTEERNRLARELHDSVTQALYSINLFANAAHLALSSDKEEVAAEHIQALRELVDEAMRDMRLLIFELRPPILKEVGLEAALKARLDAVESRSGITVQFEVEGQNELSTDMQAELYRVGQEALTNVVKHAGAKQLTLRLKFTPHHAKLEIQDDGIGFDLAHAQLSGKLGLQSMSERMQQIGGTFTIDSQPGHGTLVCVEV